MRAGDVVFCHTSGVIGKAIRFGEAIDGKKQSAFWNHVAILDRQMPDGDWSVIQAEAHGVTSTGRLSNIAPGGKYEIVKLPIAISRPLFLEFARAQVGAEYGVLTIASCVFDILLPASVCFRMHNTFICSGLVAAALCYAGYEGSMAWMLDDVYMTMPSDVYRSLTGA
jgi:hypothetical protein